MLLDTLRVLLCGHYSVHKETFARIERYICSYIKIHLLLYKDTFALNLDT